MLEKLFLPGLAPSVKFVFEEGSGLGPSTAEELANLHLGPGRYLDIDPAEDKRPEYGLKVRTCRLWHDLPSELPGISDSAYLQDFTEHKLRPVRLRWRTLRNSPLRKEFKPTEREKKILTVIKSGETGPQYCRELHTQGVRPPRKWRERGCPSSYIEAYWDRDPERGYYWRQQIQNEKSALSKKARS